MSKDEKKRIVIGVSLCYFLVFTLIFLRKARFIALTICRCKEISLVVRQSLPSFLCFEPYYGLSYIIFYKT